MSSLNLSLVIALAMSCINGCVGQRLSTDGDQTAVIRRVSFNRSSEKIVYLIRHGWHTGLILPVEGISTETWPEVRNYQNVDHVEFGWGDEDSYRGHNISLGIAAKAAFLPSSSVLHVAGFRGPVLEFYPESDVTEIRFTPGQFEKLCQFISNSFERDELGYSEIIGPGHYGESKFYRARGNYYALKTCNVWTARALRSAGLPILPVTSLSAHSVMQQSRAFGHVLQTCPQSFKRAVWGESQSE